MRSPDEPQDELFCTISIESLIPTNHPLRSILALANRALHRMEPQFQRLYWTTGRPSVPAEQVLRAMLLLLLYGFRSERRLMEEMRYNFARRWLVGQTMSQPLWDVTVFTKNRARFLKSDLAQQWLKAVVMEAHQADLIDPDNCSVDGTLLQAWASENSYQRRDDPPGTAPGAEANCSSATRTKQRRVLVSADTAYHEQDFVEAARRLGFEAHLPAWPRRKRPDLIGEALRRTARYGHSRRKRKWIERCFAWLKGQAGQRQTRFRGTDRVAWNFHFAAGVYNLLRMIKLAPAS
jgi:transposase